MEINNPDKVELKKRRTRTLAVMGILLAIASPLVTYWQTKGAIENRMQRRQDAIVRNINYNVLTRTSTAEEFQRIYEAEQAIYDRTGSVFVTDEDLAENQRLREGRLPRYTPLPDNW